MNSHTESLWPSAVRLASEWVMPAGSEDEDRARVVSDEQIRAIRDSAKKFYALLLEGPIGDANFCGQCGKPRGE